ncbi:MAG: hypothetical protein LBT81_05580 [Helicobacteraceae bacterium]|jgi:hypothetical protein|nr:hypothetical protein [Helicobacteraceae bacterium]
MVKRILLCLALLGCSPNAYRDVDQTKSCDALFYEEESVDFQLEHFKEEAEKARESGTALHLFIVSLGIMASVYPLMGFSAVSLDAGTLLLMPSVTVGYYNSFATKDEIINRYDYLEERKEEISDLLKNKKCRK